MFFPNHQGLMVSDGILEKHQGSSSEDDLQLHPPTNLFWEGEKDPLDRLCSDL